MSIRFLKFAAIAVSAAALAANSAQAGGPIQLTALNNGVSSVPAEPNYTQMRYDPVSANSMAQVAGNGCYAPIDAPLYPCPRPDVPQEVGRVIITSPALSPHEMLYPHRYRALYPPYYYKNCHGLSCLPFIPKPCLKGTEVTVKYKSSYGLFSGFYAPVGKICYSNTQWK